jgi:cytidylate kinase
MKHMSVVIISGEPYCKREEIAKETARALGYICISREVLADASRRYNVPEAKLDEALRDPSSLLHRFSNTRTRNLAYFQAALTAALTKDSVVYYGDSGHMFVSEVSHILTVRLMADLEARTTAKAEKEGLSEKKAQESLIKESEQRHKWFLSVFGLDGMEPGRFDLVINVAQISPERAANIIAETARDVKFQPITYSVKAMQDQELASRVRAALIDTYPDVTVTARNGDISIKTKALKKKEKSAFIRDQVQGMEGVSYVELGS